MSVNYSLDTSLLHLLHRAAQSADEWFARQSDNGQLTGRQFVVLAAVAAREGASQAAITDLTGIDRSTLADVVGRLQSRGMVSRERAKQDSRAYSVSLTAAGRDALGAAAPIAEWADEQIMEMVPPAKREEFVAFLRAIAERKMPVREGAMSTAE